MVHSNRSASAVDLSFIDSRTSLGCREFNARSFPIRDRGSVRAVCVAGNFQGAFDSSQDVFERCGGCGCRRSFRPMISRGKLFLVSVGPGFIELIPPLAEAALKASNIIVGYDLYLTWIAPWISGKQIHALPLKKERERAVTAIEFARGGQTVSLVSSGDVGVYGMAALALELMSEDDSFQVEIVPGISAASSCASLLGSPLSHDYAALSLSDLLCPWEMIERRARHLAKADLVIVLYNIQSKA